MKAHPGQEDHKMEMVADFPTNHVGKVEALREKIVQGAHRKFPDENAIWEEPRFRKYENLQNRKWVQQEPGQTAKPSQNVAKLDEFNH